MSFGLVSSTTYNTLIIQTCLSCETFFFPWWKLWDLASVRFVFSVNRCVTAAYYTRTECTIAIFKRTNACDTFNSSHTVLKCAHLHSHSSAGTMIQMNDMNKSVHHIFFLLLFINFQPSVPVFYMTCILSSYFGPFPIWYHSKGRCLQPILQPTTWGQSGHFGISLNLFKSLFVQDAVGTPYLQMIPEVCLSCTNAERMTHERKKWKKKVYEQGWIIPVSDRGTT